HKQLPPSIQSLFSVLVLWLASYALPADIPSRLTMYCRNDNWMAMVDDAIARYIAENILQLRQSRNMTQAQLARLSGMPRTTCTNLESGSSNPTVSVLTKIAAALQVSVEELISPPKAQAKLYRADSIPRKQRGGVLIRKLLPDYLQGLELDRMELPPGSH